MPHLLAAAAATLASVSTSTLGAFTAGIAASFLLMAALFITAGITFFTAVAVGIYAFLRHDNSYCDFTICNIMNIWFFFVL